MCTNFVNVIQCKWVESWVFALQKLSEVVTANLIQNSNLKFDTTKLTLEKTKWSDCAGSGSDKSSNGQVIIERSKAADGFPGVKVRLVKFLPRVNNVSDTEREFCSQHQFLSTLTLCLASCALCGVVVVGSPIR
jgi:hypothetical protein